MYRESDLRLRQSHQRKNKISDGTFLGALKLSSDGNKYISEKRVHGKEVISNDNINVVT